jgi:hypothetical protein
MRFVTTVVGLLYTAFLVGIAFIANLAIWFGGKYACVIFDWDAPLRSVPWQDTVGVALFYMCATALVLCFCGYYSHRSDEEREWHCELLALETNVLTLLGVLVYCTYVLVVCIPLAVLGVVWDELRFYMNSKKKSWKAGTM